MARRGVEKEVEEGQTQPIVTMVWTGKGEDITLYLGHYQSYWPFSKFNVSGLLDSGPSLDCPQRFLKEVFFFYSSCSSSVRFTLLVQAVHSTSKAGLPHGWLCVSLCLPQEDDGHFSTHGDFIRRLETCNPDFYPPPLFKAAQVTYSLNYFIVINSQINTSHKPV